MTNESNSFKRNYFLRKVNFPREISLSAGKEVLQAGEIQALKLVQHEA